MTLHTGEQTANVVRLLVRCGKVISLSLFKYALILLAIPLAGCGEFPLASPTQITIEWTTATEINTAGFNLYRGESAQGPFTKVNVQIIPASTDPVAGGRYHFEDTTVLPGQTYYYQLEDLEFGGTSTKHPPIVVTTSSPFDLVPTAIIILMAGGVLLIGIQMLRRRLRSGVA